MRLSLLGQKLGSLGSTDLFGASVSPRACMLGAAVQSFKLTSEIKLSFVALCRRSRKKKCLFV